MAAPPLAESKIAHRPVDDELGRGVRFLWFRFHRFIHLHGLHTRRALGTPNGLQPKVQAVWPGTKNYLVRIHTTMQRQKR
jgi:hypothetical protein